MTEIFVTSDNHFGHQNIIHLCNRPFYSVEEMDDTMIKNWNEIVSKNDIVINCGDFAWRGRSKEFRNKLNGIIILIRGNHDYNVSEDDGFIIVEGNITIGNMILSHHPIPLENIPKGMIHIFGHIHQNEVFDETRQMNVSVEKTDYRPIKLDEIRKLYKSV